jgi:hypothetical protein
MATDKKMKAFCRVDGSHRIVTSSLILRKSKPKVGRWVEIPAYECCNTTTTLLPTTTSTTTVAPTTTTTTSHV